MNRKFINKGLMMLYLSSVFLFFSTIRNAYSQKVFEVKSEYQADISVMIVDAPHQADLLVYKANSELEVDGNNGIWFFTEKAYMASKKVYFVLHEYQCDLKICYVEEKYKAGWRCSNKRILIE